MPLKKIFLSIMLIVFVGCGDETTVSSTVSNPTNNPTTPTDPPTTTPTEVTLSGSITYDSVPFKNTNSGALDYDNITRKAVRGALVEAVNTSGTVLASTSTDASGNYSMELNSTTVKLRVSAKLYQAPSSGEASWDFQVKDNTNGNALYTMEGAFASLGTSGTQTRNLNASSGWGGSSYAATRVAAPFSILDVVYQSMQKVLAADTDLVFPALNIYWSTGNRSGTIGTSHYNSGEVALYILGQENVDTDEYDVGVLAHEWGHYYEDQFSRSDSIGGSHGVGDILDIRLAFGEGFATAFGGLVMETQYYRDSGSSGQQGTLFAENLEAGGSSTNPGWFSEASIYHMLYDIYDATNDTGDTLTLSFASLHNLLVSTQKTTAAFTSIFTYITALKTQNPSFTSQIDAITSNESIATITDIYGTGRTNRTVNANPLYADLSVGGSVTITPNYSGTATDPTRALGAHNFVKFTIATERDYTINVSSSTGVNLNFYVYREGENALSMSRTSSGTAAANTATLSAGTYRMSIVDSNRVSGKTFTVTLN
jgi:hypothetical protein